MLLRLWAFVSSLPLGVLAAAAWAPPLTPPRMAAASVAAGAFGAALAAVAARLGDEAPDREAHVARGASYALAALPALAAVSLGLGPPAWAWLALVGALLLFAQWRASRVSGPAPGVARRAADALGVVLLGAGAALAVAVAYAQLSPASPDPDAELRARTLDMDSRVPLRALSRCGPALAGHTLLTSAGAAPRLDADGETLWFEARAADGRVQVQRRAASGEIVCWTCGEPGNNRRPAPSPRGGGVLFDTDRFASWQRPGDTEVMLVTAKGGTAPRQAALRLTSSPGRDDHASFDPTGSGVVWSHAGASGFEVLHAVVAGGHGGFVLSEPTTLFRGRAAWVAPLGWAPDGRSLFAGFGQPLRPLRGLRLDPASGERSWLEGSLVAGGVSLSADGRTLALATTRATGAARLLPSVLGDVIARWPRVPEPQAAGTRVLVGDPLGPLVPLELGALAEWGAPTGIALAPDAGGFVLGQRGPAGERILRVDLACAK